MHAGLFHQPGFTVDQLNDCAISRCENEFDDGPTNARQGAWIRLENLCISFGPLADSDHADSALLFSLFPVHFTQHAPDMLPRGRQRGRENHHRWAATFRPWTCASWIHNSFQHSQTSSVELDGVDGKSAIKGSFKRQNLHF